MKKMTFLACAAMLTSAVAFTGCKNDKNAPEPSKAEEVKTEFSIALPNQIKAGPNRMPSTTVQTGGRSEFQGMTGIKLIPFVISSSAETVANTDTRLGNNITLGDIASASTLGTNSNATVYTDVAIPLTTNSFLFYAKSAKGGTKFEAGSLEEYSNLANTTEPTAITFNLEPIKGDYNTDIKANATAVALKDYLNSIASATDGTKAWKDYTDADDAAMAAMFETFSTLHVLSSAGIARMLTDLYNSLDGISTTLATNIQAAIAATGKATVTGSTGNRTLTLNASLDNFPTSLNLPSESVHIIWESGACRIANEDEYVGANHANPALITYPASLWYFANSKIKTSNQSQQAKYNNENSWATILGFHTDAPAVNTKTRAVAIEKPIQYAVARLDVQVKLESGTLKDNTPVTPQEITCASYPVTAVLVGGQKSVGFDFKPVGATDYMIYDNIMTPTVLATPGVMEASTTYSNINSTLVLETAAATSDTDHSKDVRICVEFTNNSGEDFIGVDGCLIPKGGKFYVVATLEAWAADLTEHKVFKQDYTTTAKLNLKSLKNAYNTIPDLRTPKLELGFSVDLTWESGNTYTIDIN